MSKKNWQPITERIIKKDNVYSVKGLNPTSDDVAEILDIDENAQIFHDGEILVFKGGELVRLVEGRVVEGSPLPSLRSTPR